MRTNGSGFYHQAIGSIEIDGRSIDEWIDAVGRATAKGTTAGLKKVVRAAEKQIEAATRQHVRGNLYRMWGSEVFPDPGYARNPSATIYVNGKRRTIGAQRYWTEPGTNRALLGGYLAIPTRNAGVLNRSRDITPGEWERRNGVRLRFVYRGGSRASLLVADSVYKGRNGRGVRLATEGRGRHYARAARVTKVIFVLIREQRHANAFSVEPFIDRARAELPDAIGRAVERETRRL